MVQVVSSKDGGQVWKRSGSGVKVEVLDIGQTSFLVCFEWLRDAS